MQRIKSECEGVCLINCEWGIFCETIYIYEKKDERTGVSWKNVLVRRHLSHTRTFVMSGFVVICWASEISNKYRRERISFLNLNLQSLYIGRNEFYNSTHGVHIWKGFSRRRMSLFEKIVYDTASSAWREISSSWGWGVYWCLKLDCWLVFFFEVGSNVLFYL